jgi:adenylate kinase
VTPPAAVAYNPRLPGADPARHDALLLLGPTGAGKSPLGNHLAQHGLAGRRCVHLDFGAGLRRAAASGGEFGGLTAAELGVVEVALQGGTLLEDAHFPIAAKIAAACLRVQGAQPADLVVLNGLPRHVGQADGVAEFFTVRTVVLLDCPADVVVARIAGNTGGDRMGRMDDARDAIHRKLDLFTARTAPLLDYYAEKGVRIRRLSVTVRGTSEEMAEQLAVSI